MSPRIPAILRIASFLLAPWIVYLAVQWINAGGKRDFDGSWIGLDLAELGGMFLVARLIRVRHRTASPVAAATGTLLILDASFEAVSQPCPNWNPLKRGSWLSSRSCRSGS